ncbi:MAG: signaling protein, partial [Lawsonibacter sp.]|nr:signaling protein [Lawsonibacter sp.]
PVKYERYENGTYYWQFEAVINGEIVTQEAESKYVETINTMKANRYEIVELRYNAAGDVVTDVRKIERTDTGASAATSGQDKIYGYPFAEIKTYTVSNPAGHKVNDKESIYDVVLTGADNVTGAVGVHDFQFVTRPRTNLQHTSAGVRFTTTQIGTLRLQGRTLYVLDGQHDYGVDFIRDAKAVVIQREGTLTDNSKKVRAYGSVQEAIDSLGDADKTTQDTKEFKGIITAVLNSQGVAEWVVFYSDTVAETKTNINDPSAIMKVRVKYKLIGTSEAEATEYGVVDAVRIPGTNLAQVPSPDTHSGRNILGAGYTTEAYKKILWEPKADPIKVVVFSYSPVGGGTPGAGTKTVRVSYRTTAATASTQVGYQNVTLTLDKAGFADLDATKFTEIPSGYKLKAGPTGEDFTQLIDASTSGAIAVEVEKMTVKSVSVIPTPASRAALATIEIPGGANSAAIGKAVKAAGYSVEVTYEDDSTVVLEATADDLTWAAAAGTGKITVKMTGAGTGGADVASTEDIDSEVYATVSKAKLTGAGDIEDYEVSYAIDSGETDKIKVGDTITITYTAAEVGATTLPSGTQSAAVTGATPAAVSTTETDGSKLVVTDGTASAKATVVVTIKIKTITNAELEVVTTIEA